MSEGGTVAAWFEGGSFRAALGRLEHAAPSAEVLERAKSGPVRWAAVGGSYVTRPAAGREGVVETVPVDGSPLLFGTVRTGAGRGLADAIGAALAAAPGAA